MSTQTTLHLNVDFYEKRYILINAKQYDKSSRWITITCYNQGDIFALNANKHSVYIRYKKPDENGVLNSCRINYRGEALVELTEQMLAVDGICYVDLIVIEKGSAIVNLNTNEITSIDGTSILSTMAFCIDVQEAVVDNSVIESSYEYSGLNDALQKAEAEYSEVINMSKSYAMGNAGGIRDGENTDNSKYYSRMSRSYAIGDASNIRPNENTDNSKYYSELSHASADSADESEANALSYMNTTKSHMDDTKSYMDTTNEYMNTTKSHMDDTESYMNTTNEYMNTVNEYMGTTLSYMNTTNEYVNTAKSHMDDAGVNAQNAQSYMNEAQNHMNDAQASANNAAISEQNASNYEQLAKTHMDNAKVSEANAKESEDNAESYMNEAIASASDSLASASSASVSENIALSHANTAQSNMVAASNSAAAALESESKTYNYYLQTEAVVHDLNGAFLPMGTIEFANLATLVEGELVGAGYLYNISDNFVTDETFKGETGIQYDAGTNVYRTADGYWDVLTGTTVTGVKGVNEADYRKGNVELSAENVGAIPSTDISTIDEVRSYLGI